ncbi:MAG: tRNA (N6-isopentenyl adenosine(37)-C2)-methylthiotransferase MiaB [Phycisphaerales bacterium]|nr:MAG: tRNA (N6-isopentenyl adenosine(37)-C2)-methylthiotransferase MiaB [Phycisphaerales bacterium]
MAGKTVYLETMGCQMNVLDSELVLGQLRTLGYQPTEDAANADVALINTCSVRDHAEQKALSHMGALKKPKARRPDMVVGVIGCMAERDPDGILRNMPHVDFLCGPGELNKIPAMIDEVLDTRAQLVALSENKSRRSSLLSRALEHDSVEALDLSRAAGLPGRVLQAYVRIQRGCDKFCSFCVVPFTRGAERCRPPAQIVDETKLLADRGAKEVTLLGQTVNSYAYPDNGRRIGLADLLERVNAVEGLERIRFVTSYPGDFPDDVLAAMRDLPKVCEYLHIPVQSGSDAVLARMNRRYTVGQYVELLGRAREIVPGITLASDFIVGFCGETDAEFGASYELVERMRFKHIFCFKYSPRPMTVADKRSPDDVPQEVKRERNVTLLKLQERISREQNQSLIGQTVEVLVEGYSKAAVKARAAVHDCERPVGWRRPDQLVGRTRTDRIVVFSGGERHIGTLRSVHVQSATALTLFGELIEEGTGNEARISPPVAGPSTDRTR